MCFGLQDCLLGALGVRSFKLQLVATSIKFCKLDNFYGCNSVGCIMVWLCISGFLVGILVGARIVCMLN